MNRGYTRRGGNDQYALSVFGKPRRETTCDCERSNEPSLLQTVFLRNDQDMFKLVDRKVKDPKPLAEAQDDIRMQLRQKEMERQTKTYLADLRKKTLVDIRY